MTTLPNRTATLSGIVILGGGTGERLGGVSKPDLRVAGRRLLEWSLAHCPQVPCVVVAPDDVAVPEGVGLVMEEPPRSGPAAGFVAGWRWLVEHGSVLVNPWNLVGLVAVDAPCAGLALPELADAVAGDSAIDAALARAGEIRQNALAVARSEAIAYASEQGVLNTSLRKFWNRMSWTECAVDPQCGMDADTPDDVRSLEELLSH